MTVPLYTGTIPNRNQSQVDFDANVQDFLDYFGGALSTDVIPKINTTATAVNNNAVSAAASASAAESARNIAVSASGATVYSASTTYNEGDYVIDDITHDPYLCTTDGTVGIQPSTDTTGVWKLVYFGDTAINLFINPEFLVNQEGYTGGDITTGGYGHDMIKSIDTLNYTGSSGAGWTITSGTAGIRNDDLIAEDGNRLYVSIESGSLTIGATAGAAETVITPATPYNFIYDASGIAFITFTAATAAKGIRIATNTAKYAKPEPRAEEARCYAYFWKPGTSVSFSGYTFGGGDYGLFVVYLPSSMQSTPTVYASLPRVSTGSESLLAGAITVNQHNSNILEIRHTRSSGTYTDTFVALLGAGADFELDARY